MPFGCIIVSMNFYGSMILHTVSPIMFAILLYFWYRAVGNVEHIEEPGIADNSDADTTENASGGEESRSDHYDDAKRKARSKNKIFEAFLAMTFAVLPSVSVKIFSTFACHDIENGEYGSFLKVDYSIDCKAPGRSLYLAWACLMILVYPLGVPLMYFVLLWRKRHKLDPGQMALENENSQEDALQKALSLREKYEEEDPSLKSLSFLYSAYEPRMWWVSRSREAQNISFGGFPS